MFQTAFAEPWLLQYLCFVRSSLTQRRSILFSKFCCYSGSAYCVALSSAPMASSNEKAEGADNAVIRR